jgi:molybdopterin/thiamine biosynthesis adenylyltransferase
MTGMTEPTSLLRVKPEHRPYRLADGRVRIGGAVYGIAAELEDPAGWVWAALQLLDGTRSPDQVVDSLCNSFPGMSRHDVGGLLDELAGTGYLEDAGAPPPADLSARERGRYSRSQAFFRWIDLTPLTPRTHGWEPQLGLKRAWVVVVGVGGVGSAVGWALAASGVGHLHLVDDDVVELSNLNRQMLYTEADIGRPKVDAAVPRLQAVNTDIRITGSRRRIGSEAELADLVAGFDVLALCADEPRTPESIRVWANRACAAARQPWAVGGYDGPLVTAASYLPGGGACFECGIAAAAEHRERLVAGHDQAAGERFTLAGPGVIAPSAGLAGQLVAFAVLEILTGIPAPPTNRRYTVDLAAPERDLSGPWAPPADARRPDCPVCAV